MAAAEDGDEARCARIRAAAGRMTELHALLSHSEAKPGLWTIYAWCSDIHQRAADWFRSRAVEAFKGRRR